MSDVFNEAKKPKLSNLEKLAARQAKKAEREARKAEREAKKAEPSRKKADGWARKGRNSEGQKVYDFNSNTANGKFVDFDENSVSASKGVKAVYGEEIARNMDTGDAARSRSWVGDIKSKIEDTEERINRETGQREDVRNRKERKILSVSKNVDYKPKGAKTLEYSIGKGRFSITFTNNPDGSRSFNGFKVGPFKLNRSKGENGAKSFKVSIGNSLPYSSLTEADGTKTRKYKIGNIYSNSKTVDSKGQILFSEKTYFGKRTKTIENTEEGSFKYTTAGRSVNEMKRDGLDEEQIREAIRDDVAAGKVYRLKRTNERGEVTRDYNRQTYKGKTSDYIAGDEDTDDRAQKSSVFGLSKTNSQKLSREKIAARSERQAQLEMGTIVSGPGAFPRDLNAPDSRIVRNTPVSSRVVQSDGVADAQDVDGASLSSAASGKSSIASFLTTATTQVGSIVSGKGSIDSSATSKSTKLQDRLDERSRRRELPGASL